MRLVAKGFTKAYGIDYFETFSPVAKIASIRAILSLKENFSSQLSQLDVKKAFLHGDLQQVVYMDLPPGFVIKGQKYKVCHLKRSLHRPKKSP